MVKYTIVVEDIDSGCKDKYQINVWFQNECTQSAFHLPNIFTPSGNTSKSIFKLTAKNPEEFISLSIYDRWETSSFFHSIHGLWNGKIGGRKVETGVYVNKINLIRPITNENYVILGDITVIY